jgi:hypothetical protein
MSRGFCEHGFPYDDEAPFELRCDECCKPVPCPECAKLRAELAEKERECERTRKERDAMANAYGESNVISEARCVQVASWREKCEAARAELAAAKQKAAFIELTLIERDEAQLSELHAIADAIGTNEGHSSVDRIKELRAELAAAREERDWLAQVLARNNKNVLCEHGDAGTVEFWLRRAGIDAETAEAQLAELHVIADALGTNDGHSSVDRIKDLRAELAEKEKEAKALSGTLAKFTGDNAALRKLIEYEEKQLRGIALMTDNATATHLLMVCDRLAAGRGEGKG